MQRLFLAIELDPAVQAGLVQLSPSRLERARFTPREALHLTLHFLGDTRDEQLALLDQTLQAADLNRASLRCNGVGQFRSAGGGKILWAGVDPEPALLDLHLKLKHCLQSIGISVDPRPFHPHITLARLKSPVQKRAVADWLAQHRHWSLPAMPVESVTLYASVLSPAGAMYSPLKIYRLT